MSVAPAGVSNVLVAVSGVLQDPSTYGVSGTTLTFSTAPPSGTGNISCRYLGVPASGVTTTAYRTVTEFTATAGQTTFTPPSYTVGFINVYLNGVLLGSADYTATNGTTVVLATGAAAGNLVTVESFLVSSVLNAIPNTAGSVSSSNIQTSPTLTTPTIDKINTSVTNTSLGAGNASIMKNRIINGAMVIAQRGTSFSFASGGGSYYYGADRFKTINYTWSAGTDPTVSNDTTVYPTGFRNSYKYATGATGLTFSAGGFQNIEQDIEGYNIADCYLGNITISFWVRASTAGQYNIMLTNNPSSIERYSTRNYTINAANTWEQKSITVDLSAGVASGGTWNTTNGTGLSVQFILGAASNRTGNTGLNTWATGGSPNYDYQTTGCVNLATIANSTFYITGVQLEVGSSATGFEYRQYGTELALCQRYFQRESSRPIGKAIVSNQSSAIQLPVTMRVAPTVTGASFSSSNGGAIGTCTIEDTGTGAFAYVNSSANGSINYNYLISYSAGSEL
jgi:hypothetical protein